MRIFVLATFTFSFLTFYAQETIKQNSYQNLSKARADAVKTYLVNHNIEAERISTIGYGATKMLFPRTIDDQKMQKNRRVEIKIVDF